jgi:hypothetical protein
MKHKHLVSMVLIGICTLLLIGMNAYPFINHNGAGGGYGDGDENDEGSICSYSGAIEFYIVQGAGYFLEANMDIQSLLRQVELQNLQGIDYQEMQSVVNSALENMNNAKQSYELLVQTALRTPYNQSVIEILKDFDYESFMKEYSLNGVIFEKVRGFLQKGDITGVFKYTHSRCLEIIYYLNAINISVSRYRLPGLSICWRLNEITADVSLFGSYVARVFAGIR